MPSESAFRTLKPRVLQQIALYLKWDPLLSTSPVQSLSQSSESARLAWLDTHREQLKQHVSWVGTPIFSYALGHRKDYREIVGDLAAQIGASVPPGADTALAERKLLENLWSDTLSRLTDKEREALLAKIESVAEQYGTSIKKEAAGFAGLAAAQMSGFGVYMLGSTLLGALNSALGLGLGFGAFAGLSSAISIIIGPIGWAALGLYAIRKLGAPNYKKLLPVVILVATERAAAQVDAPAATSRVEIAEEKTKRIKITCRCGHTIIEELGEAIQDSLVECWNCGQQYAFRNGTLFRLGRTGQTEKLMKVSEKAAARLEVATTQSLHPSISVDNAVQDQTRRFSKAERTAFQLRPENRALCEITKEFYPTEHFLDLSAEEQKVIRDLKGERAQSMPDSGVRPSGSASTDRRDVRKQRNLQEAATRAGRKETLRIKAAVAKRSKDYSRLLRNIDFHPKAIERMALLANGGGISQIDEKLGQMNIGHVVYRDSIYGTDPAVYETKAGYDYRIYYRRLGPKIHVLLVGDKGTQEADLAQLRREAHAGMPGG